MPDPIRELSQLWPAVSRRIHDRLRAAYRDSDLPPLAHRLLDALRQKPGLTVSDLARETYVAKSYVSRTAEQLVSLGYVRRQPDAADQRLIRLYVTGAADAVMAELAKATELAWAEALSGLTDDELTAVTAGLKLLLSALTDQSEEQETSTVC